MLRNVELVSYLVLTVSLWGCSPPADFTGGENGSPGLAARSPKPTVYDFTQFDYTYVRAYALRSTNLEPSPTSYVLFQPKPLEEAVTAVSDESIRALQEALRQHVARVKAYCLEHEAQFDTLVGTYEADPFVNTVSFYWPLREEEGGQDKMRAQLLEEEPGSRCELLAERYDYDRAKSL